MSTSSSDWSLALPRAPSASEIFATVAASGASTMLTKSYSPSVAHWCRTLAPSSSVLRGCRRQPRDDFDVGDDAPHTRLLVRVVVRDHDGVDPVRREDPCDDAQRRPGRAGDEAPMHCVLHVCAGQVGLGCEACHRRSSRHPERAAIAPPASSAERSGPVAGIYDSSTADQRVDVDELERLQLGAAARAERERDLRDRRSVGRLDDVDEVVLAERRPLVQDLCPELLDVLVDLAEAARVRLQCLDALRRQGRQHQIGRHHRLLLARGLESIRAAWSK